MTSKMIPTRTKSQYIHCKDLDGILHTVETVVTSLVEQNNVDYSDGSVAGIHLSVKSIISSGDDHSWHEAGIVNKDVIQQWTVAPTSGLDKDTTWWKIIVTVNGVPVEESPSSVSLKLDGYQIEMKLLQCSPSPSTSSIPSHPAIDAAAWMKQGKVLIETLWYHVVGLLIRDFELPSFPHKDETFKSVYKLVKELKSGSEGQVYKGKLRSTGQSFAVKVINRTNLTPVEELAILSEVSVMSQLSHHPNVVKLVDFMEQENFFFLVMELCSGGDLFDRISHKAQYTEQDARDLCKTLLETMRHCHDEQGVAHCDMKPQNLLLSSLDNDTKIKLADFGFASRVLGPQSLTKHCGTPFFVAPEILEKKSYDQSADMWSLGVIIYILLGGTLPFTGRDRRELYTAIKSGKFEFPPEYWSNVSREAKNLIRNLLTVDPTKRMTAREALETRWIRGVEGRTLARNDLGQSSLRLRGFNARLKLKAAMIGCRMITMGTSTRGGFASAVRKAADAPVSKEANEIDPALAEAAGSMEEDSDSDTSEGVKKKKGLAATEEGDEEGEGMSSSEGFATMAEIGMEVAS